MVKVYIAGPYSADNVMNVLHNIRKGIEMSYRYSPRAWPLSVPGWTISMFLWTKTVS